MAKYPCPIRCPKCQANVWYLKVSFFSLRIRCLKCGHKWWNI